VTAGLHDAETARVKNASNKPGNQVRVNVYVLSKVSESAQVLGVVEFVYGPFTPGVDSKPADAAGFQIEGDIGLSDTQSQPPANSCIP
jgi:hypothetical protein